MVENLIEFFISANISEIIPERTQKSDSSSGDVFAVLIRDKLGNSNIFVTYNELSDSEKLETFVEDVK